MATDVNANEETNRESGEDNDETWIPFPLDTFQGRIPDKKEWKGLKKKVKKYYQIQEELIGSFKEMDTMMKSMPREDHVQTELSSLPGLSNEPVQSDDIAVECPNSPISKESWWKKFRRSQTWLAQLTLFCNVCLLVAKAVVVGFSGSLAIISSLLDSCVDLITGISLWWTARQVKNRDLRVYPQGRTRLEPVVIIILAVIMSVVSCQIIRESIQSIVDMTNGKDPPEMNNVAIILTSATIVIKVVLWYLCYRYGNTISILALSQDNRNDVISNSAALLFSAFSGRIPEAIMNSTGRVVSLAQNISSSTNSTASSPIYQQGNQWLKQFKYLDPIGATLIALYIIRSWWKTGNEHVQSLTGHVASPEFHQKICYIALSHHPRILAVDTVMAFHFGHNFLVEVDILLPAEMPLFVAHDIGEALQRKLELLPEVERAFVHLDYETGHTRSYEHKVL